MPMTGDTIALQIPGEPDNVCLSWAVILGESGLTYDQQEVELYSSHRELRRSTEDTICKAQSTGSDMF